MTRIHFSAVPSLLSMVSFPLPFMCHKCADWNPHTCPSMLDNFLKSPSGLRIKHIAYQGNMTFLNETVLGSPYATHFFSRDSRHIP